MLHRVRLFPLVTLSRKIFLQYIIEVCRDVDMDIEQEKKWIEYIEKEISRGHYFEGMIFMESRSLYIFTHELIHHVARLLREYTKSKMFYIIDYLIDEFDIWLFNKE